MNDFAKEFDKILKDPAVSQNYEHMSDHLQQFMVRQAKALGLDINSPRVKKIMAMVADAERGKNKETEISLKNFEANAVISEKNAVALEQIYKMPCERLDFSHKFLYRSINKHFEDVPMWNADGSLMDCDEYADMVFGVIALGTPTRNPKSAGDIFRAITKKLS